ncbi:thiopurine S-methyltransferase, partial [Marinomonas arenicola]
VQFLGDHDFVYITHEECELKIHTVEGLYLRIVEGDFFTFKETGFYACYDRAAMVSMPSNRRAEYVSHA